MDEISITSSEAMSNSITYKVNDRVLKIINSSFQPSGAKDVPCLADPPDHNWYERGIYMKCSKCGMSYEKPAIKGLIL